MVYYYVYMFIIGIWYSQKLDKNIKKDGSQR
jgi:hypothetical protein